MKRLAQPEIPSRSQCQSCAMLEDCGVYTFTCINACSHPVLFQKTLAYIASSFFFVHRMARNLLSGCCLGTRKKKKELVLPLWVIIGGWLALYRRVFRLYLTISICVLLIVLTNVGGENWKQLSLTQHGVWFPSQTLCSFFPINHLRSDWKTSLQTNTLNNEDTDGNSISC